MIKQLKQNLQEKRNPVWMNLMTQIVLAIILGLMIMGIINYLSKNTLINENEQAIRIIFNEE